MPPGSRCAATRCAVRPTRCKARCRIALRRRHGELGLALSGRRSPARCLGVEEGSEGESLEEPLPIFGRRSSSTSRTSLSEGVERPIIAAVEIGDPRLPVVGRQARPSTTSLRRLVTGAGLNVALLRRQNPCKPARRPLWDNVRTPTGGSSGSCWVDLVPSMNAGRAQTGLPEVRQFDPVSTAVSNSRRSVLSSDGQSRRRALANRR
jgi:hypothetical protein